jgi:site-specific DNA-methyltransferase (adenine-specific)
MEGGAMEEVTIGDATLYLGDCMDAMRSMPDGAFDLAIVDPPYFEGPNRSGYYGKGYSSLGVQRAKYYGEIKSWAVPEAEYFDELRRVSRHQIIWGANHFADRFNAASPSWIVWDKVNGGSTFADAELAYCSMDCAVRMFRYVWNGMHQGQYGGNKRLNEARIHPTQKPVALYEWLLDHYAEPGQKILDTHLGSGSSAIAARSRGFEFCGIELDADHFRSAVQRIESAARQQMLFTPEPTKHEQGALI